MPEAEVSYRSHYRNRLRGRDLTQKQSQSEDEGEADNLQAAVDFDFDLTAEHATTSTEISNNAKTSMIQSAMRRICAAGTDGASSAIWVPLVVRLITRGLQPEEGEEDDEITSDRRESLRQIMFDFVIADLRSRSVCSLLATA